MLAIAKITAKWQTTIPQDVRAALHVGPGDLIAWEVRSDGTATVRRVQPLDCPIEDLAAAVRVHLNRLLGNADPP